MSDENAIQECLATFDTAFFKVFTEPSRLEIFKRLVLLGRSDVRSIAEGVPQDVSVVSRHLAHMERAGVVVAFKEGRHRYYEVNAPGILERLEAILHATRNMMPLCCPGPVVVPPTDLKRPESRAPSCGSP